LVTSCASFAFSYSDRPECILTMTRGMSFSLAGAAIS
jgi:hypothetical protein